MTRANIRVINDSKPAKYFYQVPNLIDDMGLSVYAYRIYLRLVRISSLRNALSSTRGLAKDCKMSAGSVSNAKAELITAGLISITKQPSGRGEDYDVIHILDITARNVLHCETLRISSSGELSDKHSSSGERDSSSGERDSSSGERDSSSGEQVGITSGIQGEERGKTEEEESASAPPAPTASALDILPTPSVTVTETRAGSRVLTLQSAPENGKSTGRASKRGGKGSPANYTEHADKRVHLYLENLRPEITPTNAELILSRVSLEYVNEWEAAISDHATGKGRGRSYNPTDFNLLFDLYEARVIAKKAEPLAAKHAKAPAAPAYAAKPAPRLQIVEMMRGNIARP